MGAVNYLNIPDFIRAFLVIEWEDPEQVQLLLKDEHEQRFTVHVPLSQALPSGTPEQKARDMLERLDIEDAQQMTAGDVVELANAIHDAELWRKLQEEIRIDVYRNSSSMRSVKVTHVPTGISVTREGIDEYKTRREAMQELAGRVSDKVTG